MRKAARTKSRGGQVSRTHSSQAPVRGWNARDSIAAMKPGDAIKLTNWFPTTSDVELRKGMAAHVTGITDSGAAQVETLVSYRPVTGTHKLWAFAGTKLFDATSAGAAPAATVSGLSNARWQCVNFTTTGGNFLIGVNGADSLQLYDGSSWAAITGVSTPAITGVTTSDLIHVNVFKERVYYIQKASLDVWYTGVGAFSGALTKFALGSIFKRGGYLMAMGTWSVDGGQGIDDLAVFITSQGEVAVYQGTSPASWSLVGIFNIGAPLGRRCMTKFGGDLLIITQDGVVPASKAFISDRTSSAVALTDRISGALRTAAQNYGSNFGWELTQYPNGGALILNVPAATNQQTQYVMNTTTGAWADFTGWTANTFEVHNDALYFGMLGEVRKAWTGVSDAGAAIVAEAIGAFDYFATRNALKQVRMIRPVIGWDANPTEFRIGVDADFVTVTPNNAISLPAGVGTTWDTGTWDVGLWGGEVILNTQWYTAFALGYALAPHIKVSSNAATIRWAATDFLYEPGGVL